MTTTTIDFRTARLSRGLRRQRGAMLLDYVLAIGLISVLMAGFVSVQQTSFLSIKTGDVASNLDTITRGVQSYLSAYSNQVAAATSVGGPALAIPIARTAAGGAVPAGPAGLPSVQGAGFLPPGFIDRDQFGQTHELLVRQPTAGQYEAMVVSQGGQDLTDAELGELIGRAGGQAGEITNADPAVIDGVGGAWSSIASAWANNTADVPVAAGHYAATVQYTPNVVIGLSPYLDRYSVSGTQEPNTMHTTLYMNRQPVTGAASYGLQSGGSIQGGGVNAYGPNAIIANTNEFQIDGATVTYGPATVGGALSVYGSAAVSGSLSVRGSISAGGNISTTAGNISTAGGSIMVTGFGNITTADGNISTLGFGNISAQMGNIQTNNGNIQTNNGDVLITGFGNLQTNAGDIVTGNGNIMVAGMGNIQTQNGNIQSQNGNIQTQNGSISTTNGNITAGNGYVATQTYGLPGAGCPIAGAIGINSSTGGEVFCNTSDVWTPPSSAIAVGPIPNNGAGMPCAPDGEMGYGSFEFVAPYPYLGYESSNLAICVGGQWTPPTAVPANGSGTGG